MNSTNKINNDEKHVVTLGVSRRARVVRRVREVAAATRRSGRVVGSLSITCEETNKGDASPDGGERTRDPPLLSDGASARVGVHAPGGDDEEDVPGCAPGDQVTRAGWPFRARR
ncbi:hypothetical protein EVAR_15041_1 [Eumeta japonica]|uniref:Uncharacterized protein n=1 Tax=Eumeta variegata TaxID=151549 RepID=A0A4C1X5K7_EUMVA|nr:hypothetical protein EVAR_15041_1 [Eumeta japonica]